MPNLYNLQKQAKFKLTEYIEMMQSLINFLNLDLGRDKPYFVKTTLILQNSFDNFRLKLSTTSRVSQLVLTVRILLETCWVSRMHHTSYMGLLKNKLVWWINKSNTINGTPTAYTSIARSLFVHLLVRLHNKNNTINGTPTAYSSIARPLFFLYFMTIP